MKLQSGSRKNKFAPDLMLNGIVAMKDAPGELVITLQRTDERQLLTLPAEVTSSSASATCHEAGSTKQLHGFSGLARIAPVLSRQQHADHFLISQTVGMVPPSITYSLPVIEDARSETRNATNSATSSGRFGRPSGIPPSDFIKL